jgi:DeoR family glycerol-3-phosphate regulon repressor
VKLNPRQKQILVQLNGKEFVSVETLSQQFDMVSQTIRRDITQLCDLGLARRHHGGVGPLPSAENLSFGSRQVINAKEKQAIAQQIAKAIPDHASISLGIGTTAEAIAKQLLNKKGLKIITNNLNVASIFFQNSDIEVLVSGGKLRPLDQDLVGDNAVSFFNSYYVDFAIVSVGSLDIDRGLMDFDMDNVAITHSILNNAQHTILAADESKWNKKAFAKVAAFSAIDCFYTDHLPPTNICERLRAVNIEINYCAQSSTNKPTTDKL